MKKVLVGILSLSLVIGALGTFSVYRAEAQSMTIQQLVQLLISIGIISPDKANAALAAVNSVSVNSAGSASAVPSIIVTNPSGKAYAPGSAVQVNWKEIGFTPKNIHISINNTTNGQASSTVIASLRSSNQLSFTASIPQWTPSGTSTISVCDDGTISSAWASICGTSNPFNVVSNTSAVSAAAVTPVVVTPTYLTLLMVQGKQYTDPNTVLTGSGPSRISWNMVSGSLPPGITAYPNNSTFELLGTPTQVGTYNFVLNVLGYTNVIDVYPSSSVSVSVSVTIDPAATSMNSAASSNLGSAFVSIDQLLRLLDALK